MYFLLVWLLVLMLSLCRNSKKLFAFIFHQPHIIIINYLDFGFVAFFYFFFLFCIFCKTRKIGRRFTILIKSLEVKYNKTVIEDDAYPNTQPYWLLIEHSLEDKRKTTEINLYEEVDALCILVVFYSLNALFWTKKLFLF